MLDVIFAGLLILGMFNVLRQLERWLHQHIFKVGWLVTKDFQTTTVLYYTFFLPGVFLYEFVYWLVAGALDVRAERAIGWPEKQESGELKLNFVKLSRKANKIQVAIISIAPLFAGLVAVWFIANNIFNIPDVIQTMSTGTLDNVAAGLQQLTSTPDFWLWSYLMFTISNSMMPAPGVLKSWGWAMVTATAIFSLPLFLLGVGDDIVGDAFTGPIASGLNTLSGVFAVIIVFNVLAVLILGTLEAVIERITGDSATFKNGKMIVMTREEVIERRKQEREKQRANQDRKKKKSPAMMGPPSVYKLAFPVPGPPGSEPVTQPVTTIIASSDENPEEKDKVSDQLQINSPRPQRIEPGIITGTATRRADDLDTEVEDTVDVDETDEEERIQTEAVPKDDEEELNDSEDDTDDDGDVLEDTSDDEIEDSDDEDGTDDEDVEGDEDDEIIYEDVEDLP